MSIFALVYLGEKTDPVMAASIDMVSLLMLGFGLAGIAFTLLMALKSQRERVSKSPNFIPAPNPRSAFANPRSAPCRAASLRPDQTSAA
jgi:hypothetical protein